MAKRGAETHPGKARGRLTLVNHGADSPWQSAGQTHSCKPRDRLTLAKRGAGPVWAAGSVQQRRSRKRSTWSVPKRAAHSLSLILSSLSVNAVRTAYHIVLTCSSCSHGTSEQSSPHPLFAFCQHCSYGTSYCPHLFQLFIVHIALLSTSVPGSCTTLRLIVHVSSC